jgi:hypothetical protein
MEDMMMMSKRRRRRWRRRRRFQFWAHKISHAMKLKLQ